VSTVRVTLRVSSPGTPVPILVPRTTSTTHKLRKYNSLNSPLIQPSLSRLQLLVHVHSYAIHNLISPYRHCLYNKTPSTHHTSTDHRLVLTPPRCQSPPAHTTRTTNLSTPRLRNVHLENLGPDLHRRYQFHTISPGLHEIEPPQWDRRLHHGHTAFCTWPTIDRYIYGYIRDIPHHPPHSHTFCT